MAVTDSTLKRQPNRTRGDTGTTRKAGIVAGSAFTAIVVWFVLARFIIADELLLPGPISTVTHFLFLVTTPDNVELRGDILASSSRVLVGWLLGIVIGVPLGAALAMNNVLRIGADPLLQALRSIPPLAFAPLMVVWLGLGEPSKFVLIALGVMPIIAINTSAAIGGIDKSIWRVTATMGASPLYRLRRVILPATLADIFTSMRVTYGLAWATVVAAELVASTEGLGYRILMASQFLDTNTIFAGILAIGLLALLGDRVLLVLQKIAVPWRGVAS